MGYKKCRTWRCGFNISTGKRHCPGCGFPTSLAGRLLVHLRLARRGPSLRPLEVEIWKVINKANDEWQKLATLEGDLTGYHEPKMPPKQKAAIEKGKSKIRRKVQPALQQLKEVEVARWQNGWTPVALELAERAHSDAELAKIDQKLYLHTRAGSALNKRWKNGIPEYEGLFTSKTHSDAELAKIDQKLYLHTRAGSALNKRWKNGIPEYEGLFTSKTKSMEASVFRLAVTIIRIREWISARRTVMALGDISAFTDDSRPAETVPADDISDWLEMIYDREEQLQQLTNEALRLDVEEDVDRLLESGSHERPDVT